MPCSLHTDMPAHAVSGAIPCCFQRRFQSFKPPQIQCSPILSPRMDTADIQGKLLAYFNQLSPEARDCLLASAPAQETQPQPASGSGNAQPGQTLPTKAPPPVVTGQAQAQSPESGSTPNPAPDASASSLLADELADMKKSASTRRKPSLAKIGTSSTQPKAYPGRPTRSAEPMGMAASFPA